MIPLTNSGADPALSRLRFGPPPKPSEPPRRPPAPSAPPREEAAERSLLTALLRALAVWTT
jgi:hypothetical protein